MKKLLVLVLTAALLGVLCGCAQSDPSKTIVVYNWEDYIDPEVLEDFTEETGIKVDYQRFTTNEDMWIKMTKGGTSYDVVFPSDYMIERMIAQDLLLTIDHSKLPDYDNLYDWMQNPGYDENNTYSIPYMWGTVGVLYNIDMTGEEITSWKQLWDTKYVDQVCMMDSIRDTLGVTLKMLGYPINTREQAHLQDAKAALIEQKQSGVLLAYGVDDIKDKLINGECAIGLVWSGDAVYAMDYNESLRYSVPEEGSNVWLDGMVIPKTSKNPDGAMQFIAYMMRPDIAARNSEYIGYSTPSEAAMALMDESYQTLEAFNPPQEVIDRCEWFHDLPSEDLPYYESIWTEITAN